MRRFFVTDIFGDDVHLSGNEAKHIMRVLRMEPGDKLVLFDGSGIDYTARIVEMDGNTVTLKVLEEARSAAEPDVKVTIYQAVIKNDNFDYVVQKCTELGVERIVPFLSERCVKQPKSVQNFVERARRIALEACKQCGRSRVPNVTGVISFDDLLGAVPNESFAVLAYENEQDTTFKQLLQQNKPAELAVIIGPEGGFSPEEAQALVDAGAHSASLGKLILRAETAGPAALAMAVYEYGE